MLTYAPLMYKYCTFCGLLKVKPTFTVLKKLWSRTHTHESWVSLPSVQVAQDGCAQLLLGACLLLIRLCTLTGQESEMHAVVDRRTHAHTDPHTPTKQMARDRSRAGHAAAAALAPSSATVDVVVVVTHLLSKLKPLMREYCVPVSLLGGPHMLSDACERLRRPDWLVGNSR